MSAQTFHSFDQDAFVVEAGDRAAGIAFQERGGYRFMAIDVRYRLLDGSRFRRVAQLEQAVRNLDRAVGPS